MSNKKDHAQEYFRRRNSEEDEEDFNNGCCGCIVVVGLCLILIPCLIGQFSGTSRDTGQQPQKDQKARESGQEKRNGQAAKCQIILTTTAPVIKGADAWVELDEKRVTEWPVGHTEVTISTTQGEHVISIISIYKGVKREVFRRKIVIEPGDTQRIDVGL